MENYFSPGHLPREPHRDIGTAMFFIAALFTVAKKWNQCFYPSADQ